MKKTVIVNAKAITPFRVIENAAIIVEGEKISAVVEKPLEIPSDCDYSVIDAKGRYASPGFIDRHVHGGGGADLMTGNPDDVVKMCLAHASYGTTSIMPTASAASSPMTLGAIEAVKKAGVTIKGSNILGIHLEGPFFSMEQRGAQNPEFIIPATREVYMKLLDAWDGVRLMSAAPEVEGGLELGRELRRRGITAAIAHSNATFDEVVMALENGYTNIGHIYSGCSLTRRVNAYRIAGVVEAGLTLNEITVEVIGDGKHLPPSLLRHIYHCKGSDRICLITDGLTVSAMDLPDGHRFITENGVERVIDDGVVKVVTMDSFAGSLATLSKVVNNMVKLADVPLVEAVKMATYVPAKSIGISDRKGILAAGMDADIILFNAEVQVSTVMVMGTVYKQCLSVDNVA